MIKEENRCDAKGDGIQDSDMLVSSPFSDVSTETKPIAVLGHTRRTSGPTRRSTKGGWTNEEDELLTEVVSLCNGKNWKKIAEHLPGRSDVQCLHRWQKVLNPELVKGPWTKEEDNLIIELVKEHGSIKWSVIAKSLKGRTCKQCRERWHNHLNPALKKGAWTTEEEAILIHAHGKYGNKWAEIAKLLPGRADNSVKNHWNCSLKKRLDTDSASGLPDHLPGIATVDLKTYVDGHCMASNIDLVQSASPEILSFELQLNPPGDSKCLAVDSKCTTLESHYHKPFNEEILESPRRSKKDWSDRSCLVVGETTSSSFPAGDLSDSGRVEDGDHVRTTPSCCATGMYGRLFNPSLQLMDKEGSISSESLSTSVGYTRKAHHSIHRSGSPPDLSLRLACNPPSPISILRSLSKSFPTPSIIRKRGHASSAPLLVGETADASDSARSSDLSVKAKSLKRAGNDDRADLDRTGDLSDGHFFFSLVHDNPGTAKSVTRRLEDEFVMEQDDS